MKKLMLATVVVSALSATSAFAKDSTGCGLGSMIWDGQSGIVPQVLAATTNGTSGNQTFGITTGTLGCDSNGTISSAQKLSMFTGSNMERLARDMSAGQGEALETMAELMGVEQADKAAFFAATQSNFSTIFSSENVTAEQVIASVKGVMKSDAQLAKYTA